ncbi:MAG: N-6 DNA methylase [Prevotella sp.]
MMISDRINEFAKNVFQLFWHDGITDTMDMLYITMDILYLRRKNDSDIRAFEKYEDCRWRDLFLLTKAVFDDVYKHRVVPFLMSSKRKDLSFVNKHLIDIKYVEFSGYYELFHLTDDFFVSLNLEPVNTRVFQLHGLVLDGLIDSFGSLKNQKGIILPHIAKLMCCLLDINIEDKIFVPNCGVGELLIYSDYQALISKIPPSRRGQDSNGLDDLVNIDDSFLKTNHHLVQQYATEDNEVLSYICAMNIFLHGVEMKHQIDGLNFWDESFLYKSSNKFSKILAQIIEKDSNLRQLEFNAIINMLSSKGKAAVLVNEAFLFTYDSKSVAIRKKMLEDNILEAVISLPKGGLLSSRMKTSILILSKQKKDDLVWFCELANDGYSSHGKLLRNGAMPLPHLVANFKKRAIIDDELMYSMNISENVLLAQKAMLVLNYYRPIESKTIREDPFSIFSDLQILEDKIHKGLDDLSKLL